ncbi:MAG: potassium-transporting ATPase subunit KdpA, partial [Burkholderiales bacterium]
MNAFLQCVVYVVALLALAQPLGAYMANVYEGRTRFLAPLENLVYRIAGVRPDDDMHWMRYLWGVLWFNLLGFGAVYALQRLQGLLPLNPQKMAAVSPDSSFNTAVSFASNTNWQGYAGELTMSYLTQMLGLAVQNFLSAATGMAVLIALARGFARRQAAGIGNFWVDVTRTTLYVLLPLSLLLSGALVTQGVVQTFAPYKTVKLLQPVQYLDGKEAKTATDQTLPVGPVASQVAIKQLGTNGGGFFNANSAHPFENPTPLS